MRTTSAIGENLDKEIADEEFIKSILADYYDDYGVFS